MSDFLTRRKLKFNALRLLRKKSQSKEADIEITEKEKVLEDLFITCPSCKISFAKNDIRKNLYVCPNCGHHYPMTPEKRLRALIDEGTFKMFRYHFSNINPLGFPDYEEKIISLQDKTGQREAVFSGVAEIDGIKTVIAIMNSKFLMGSMGIVVGEMITRAIEYADTHKLPLLVFTASGGARMQEGMYSLFQMAKTSAALAEFRKKGGLYMVYFTNPTTGGVSASFAGLGDITLAEPKALIGFAGPRVIEQTIGEKLPEGFQSAEYLEQHGFVDQVVERKNMRKVVSQILKLHDTGKNKKRV